MTLGTSFNNGDLAVPVNRRESLRFAYGRGAYTTVGAAFNSFGVSYAYVWGGGL